MEGMDMTQSTFDETDVVRDTAGQFAEKTQSAPELSLDAESREPLFEADIDGVTYAVHDEGSGTFSVYRGEDGPFVTNFAYAGDIEDHLNLEEAAAEALTAAQVKPAAPTFGEHELAFMEATKVGVFDLELAGKALRDAAARLCPTATAIRFSTNYTDGGASLFAYDLDGDDELVNFDDFDDIVYPMSGRHCTGEEIPGMRPDGDDQFIFDLTPQA